MVYTVNQKRRFRYCLILLLLFISSIAFQSYVCADVKEKSAIHYRDQGYQEQQKGNVGEALTNYTKAVSLGLQDAAFFNDLAILYEQVGSYTRAERFYVKAIQEDKYYLPAYMNLAYLYQNFGQNDKAFEYFKRRYELGKPNDAWTIKAKNELLKIRPEYQDYINKIDAKRLKEDVVQQKRDAFNRRIQESKDTYQKGLVLLEEGKYKTAIYAFDHALKLTPGNPKIIQSRKKAELEMAKEDIRKRSDEAIQMLDAGNTISAQNQIRQMLTTIPKEPIIYPK